MGWVSYVYTIFSYIGATLILLLRLIWIPVSWILHTLFNVSVAVSAPLLYIAHFITKLCYAPIYFLARFEVTVVSYRFFACSSFDQTLYIYFGAACIIGCLAGVLLHYSTRLFVIILGLDVVHEESPGRTAASYRAERARKHAQKAREVLVLEGLQTHFDKKPIANHPDGMLTRGGTKNPSSPAPQKGLLSTTIFEEEDSSDEDFG